ncbi:MAG: hypothetical protein WCC10_18490 [Tumebacillaceae bacterium]
MKMYTELKKWQVSIPLKHNHAEQYRRVLRALGHEAGEPEKVRGGWIVKWRPQRQLRVT